MQISDDWPMNNSLSKNLRSFAKGKVRFLWVAFLAICVSPQLIAAQLTTAISAYYYLVGDGSLRYSSVEELINNINQHQELIFIDCTSKASYSCTKYTITSAHPNSAFGYRNGEPVFYDLPRTATTKTRDINGNETSSTSNAGGLGASQQPTCAKPFTPTSISDGANSVKMQCLYVEPQANVCDGNPINLGTAEKFEKEIDFSTADGVLTITRFYVNQFSGWVVDEPNRSVEVPANSSTPEPSYSSNNLSTSNASLELRKRWSTTEPYGYETYFHSDPLVYLNPLPERIVYLTLGRQRYRFVERGNAFVGDGPISAKTKLVELAPASPGVIRWKLTEANNDVSYFYSEGAVQRTEFANGGSVTYQYSGNRLLSKTDHLGRSLTYGYDTNGRLTSITQPDGQIIHYDYGTDAKTADFYLLKKVTWPNGESVSYSYNEPSLITSSTNTSKALTGKFDSLGNRIGTYKYTGNQATSTESALGSFKRTFQFNSNYTSDTTGLNTQRLYYFNTTLPDGTKLLTGTNQPAGSGCGAATKSATYDAVGLKKTETGFTGNKTQFAYDTGRALETVRVEGVPAGNSTDYTPVNTVLVAGARKTSTQWHSQWRKPVKTAEPRLLTTYIYNGDADPFNNNLVATCAPTALPLLCHKVQQATTDSNGAAGLTASLDNTQTAREWVYTYNANGQLLTRARGLALPPEETRDYYSYTAADWHTGDLKSVTNAAGHHTNYTRYDANGRLLQMQDANGVTTDFSYDARGRLTQQTLAGATTTHSYDSNGNRTSSLLPNGVQVTYEYDIAKRLTSVSNALGDKISFDYDVESNLLHERATNASGGLTYLREHVYDALSREKNTYNSNGQGSTHMYDAKGNPIREQDAKSQLTSHSYTALDQLKLTTDALNGKTEYSYDAQGHISQVKDARGNITSYSYNAFGDLTQQSSPDTGITTFTYDASGNRTSATDARNVSVNYTHDALNRLSSVEYPASSSENVLYTYDDTTNGNFGIGRLTGISSTASTLTFHYNAQGLITQKYVQIGTSLSTIGYSYDSAGNLSGITYPSGRTVTYNRDAAGRIDTVTTKANATASEQTILSNISYLPFGPANSYSFGNGLSHSASYDTDYRFTGIQVGGVLSRGYSYDLTDNITGISDLLASSKSQTLGYDALNRLTSATGGYGNLGYTYDAVGNRLTETATPPGGSLATNTYSYATTSNRLNAITQTGASNLTRSFSYDTVGNRTQGTSDSGTAQTYAYNNANRLTSATNGTATAGTYAYNPLGQRISKIAGSTSEYYHYDEAGHLLAVTNTAGATTREYIYKGDQLAAFVTIAGTPAVATTYYVHNDHLGTPQVVTNQAKQVVYMADYQPFGKLTPGQTNSIELYSRFPGQFVDMETGLYYNYFRDYDPSIGRYIESDPIGLKGGINTYAYVSGNPSKLVDLRGLQAGIVYPLLPYLIPGLTPWLTPKTDQGPTYQPNTPYNPNDPYDLGYPTNIYNTVHDDSDFKQTIPYQANRRQYHNRCDEPEPQNFLNDCDRAQWNLQKAKDCKDLRQAMTDKWFNGISDADHEFHMSQIQNQIDSAQRWVNQICRKECR